MSSSIQTSFITDSWKVEISGFFGDLVVSCDAFLKTCVMRKCFAENRHIVFFWKLPGKKALDVLLGRARDV